MPFVENVSAFISDNLCPNRIFTVDSSIILRTAGRFSTEQVEAVVMEIIRINTDP